MAFAGNELKVVLTTWHEPLESIPRRLRKEPELLEQAILHTVDWARMEALTQPRIAVCGLNPHAGEGGLLGSEERDFLNPTIARLQKRYPGLCGCLPADTVFHRQREGEFDYVVALYHDQALIPVKTLEFHAAVNVTLESVSEEAHVFFTLQPPFISDKNGTWCPKMGSWCAQFGSDNTFQHNAVAVGRFAAARPSLQQRRTGGSSIVRW